MFSYVPVKHSHVLSTTHAIACTSYYVFSLLHWPNTVLLRRSFLTKPKIELISEEMYFHNWILWGSTSRVDVTAFNQNFSLFGKLTLDLSIADSGSMKKIFGNVKQKID